MNRRALLAAVSLLTVISFPLVGISWPFIGGKPLSGGNISPDGSQINTLSSIGGSLTNKYGIWTFGPGSTPPTGANPPGPFGTFNYVKLNGRVINRIGQFGITGRTGASQIVVNYGGEVFFLTTENDRIWYQYANYGPDNSPGGACPPCDIDPSLVLHLPGPNALPPFIPSAPGSTVSSSPGCVTSVDGVWCAPGGTSWQPTLNGIPFNQVGGPPSRYNSITVACNGQLFALSDDARMYTALSLAFNESWAVSSSALPTCPIAIEVTVTPNPTLVSGSIPGPQITSGTPTNTVVATYVVTMSDSSSYAGTPGLDTGGATFIGLGATPGTIVTTGTPTPSGNYFTTVQPVAGRQPAGAPTIEVVVH